MLERQYDLTDRINDISPFMFERQQILRVFDSHLLIWIITGHIVALEKLSIQMTIKNMTIAINFRSVKYQYET